MNNSGNIREIIKLPGNYVLVIGENKTGMVLDVVMNQLKCNIDLAPDSAILSKHITSYNNEYLVVVSELVIEFYKCINGIIEYIGSMAQNAFSSNGRPIQVTDVEIHDDRIIFATNIGTFLFFEFPSLRELGVLQLTKTPIERFCYSKQKNILYVVDTNKVFVAAEIEPNSLKFIRARAEEELPVQSYNGIVELFTTSTGCIIHCGSVYEYSLENPAITTFNIKLAHDVYSNLRYVYIITSNTLNVFLHSDPEPLHTFTFPIQEMLVVSKIVADRALIFSPTSISITPIPTIQQPKNDPLPNPKYNVVFKTIKVSKDSTIIALNLVGDRSIYGLDSKGRFYFAQGPKNSLSNVVGIGEIESRGAEYANLDVDQNGNYAVVAMGFGLHLIHTKTQKILASSVAPKEPPQDCISALSMRQDNNCIIGVGFRNGLVAVMNVQDGSFYVAQKHQTGVIKIVFVGDIIISLSSDGYLCINEQSQKVGDDVVSFDIWQRQTCMIVCKMSIKLYSLTNWELIGEFNSLSPIINAKYSCDGNFIIIAARDRCSVLNSQNLNVMMYLSTTSLLRVLKTQENYQPAVINMDVSKQVPCQFVLSFTGGSVMIIEPRNYLEWRY